jgi:DNA-3-methyladenine glycosylase II
MNWTKKGIEYIKRHDPVLRQVILKSPAFDLKPSGNYLKDLIGTVISQQLSYKVYFVLEKRLFLKLGNKIEAGRVLRLPDAEFRYIKNVAAFYKDNPGFFGNIDKYSDSEITAGLIKIKGIGEWSVQMFLIFNLVRPDVFPLKDLGIRRAIQKLYGLRSEPTEKQMLRIAEKWGNYKTIATWYLWRSLEKI